jgi:hypothetical protein
VRAIVMEVIRVRTFQENSLSQLIYIYIYIILYEEIIALESLEHLSYSLFIKELKEENRYSTFWKIENG